MSTPLTFGTWLIQSDAAMSLAVTLLLIALAIAAVALIIVLTIFSRRRQSQLALEQRIAELETLEDASRAIVASELNTMALCKLIAEQAGKIINTDTFQIGLFEDHLYEILFWRINGEEQNVPVVYDLQDSIGIVGWVREHKQSLLIEDLKEEIARLPQEPHYVSRNPTRSAIFLPLISGETVLGVMAAQHGDPHQFTKQDLGRLAILGNQAAAAIANAHLYEQARTRAEDLEMVSWISQQVNELQDMEDILRQVVTLTRERFDFHPISILSVDMEREDSVLEASSVGELGPGGVRVPFGKGVIGAALEKRSTVVVNDVEADERFVRQTGVAAFDGEASKTRSEIAIPLLVNDQVIGVLDVQSDRVGGFSQREQTVLEALANTVASALEKAFQLNQQREQAWVTTAQLQVADAINQGDDLDELLASIVRLTPLLVGVETCAILLWNPEIDRYVPGAIYGVSVSEDAHFHALEFAVGDWGPLDAVHVGGDKLRTKIAPPWLTAERQRLTTLRPLSVPGRWLGVMLTDTIILTDTPHISALFNTERARQTELMAGIVEQTSRAIERQTLKNAQEEEAWVNTALLQVAEAVNSLFDLNEILGTIVRLVPMLVGVEAALLMTWDADAKMFRVGPSYGVSENLLRLLDRGFDLSLLEIEAHDLSVLAETKTYTIKVPDQLVEGLGTESAEFIPLHARGKLVGALLVGQPGYRRPLTERRLHILTGIAQQAALAVVNDQLYKESAERERLEQEIAVARNIQSSLLPDSRPHIPGLDVAAYWRAARQVSGDFYDFLALPNGTYGILIADVADKGIPAALFMALCRTIIRSVGFTRLEPGITLSRANDIIINDTESDLFVTVFYAVWNPATRIFTYANGGHNPPLFVQSNGDVTLLHADGIAMGILEEMAFEEKSIYLAPGDTVVMYTDGVNETMDAVKNEFGMDRLQAIIIDSRTESAVGLRNEITLALDEFAGSEPQFDDTTLVIIKSVADDEPQI